MQGNNSEMRTGKLIPFDSNGVKYTFSLTPKQFDTETGTSIRDMDKAALNRQQFLTA